MHRCDAEALYKVCLQRAPRAKGIEGPYEWDLVGARGQFIERLPSTRAKFGQNVDKVRDFSLPRVRAGQADWKVTTTADPPFACRTAERANMLGSSTGVGALTR